MVNRSSVKSTSFRSDPSEEWKEEKTRSMREKKLAAHENNWRNIGQKEGRKPPGTSSSWHHHHENHTKNWQDGYRHSWRRYVHTLWFEKWSSSYHMGYHPLPVSHMTFWVTISCCCCITLVVCHLITNSRGGKKEMKVFSLLISGHEPDVTHSAIDFQISRRDDRLSWLPFCSIVVISPSSHVPSLIFCISCKKRRTKENDGDATRLTTDRRNSCIDWMNGGDEDPVLSEHKGYYPITSTKSLSTSYVSYHIFFSSCPSEQQLFLLSSSSLMRKSALNHVCSQRRGRGIIEWRCKKMTAQLFERIKKNRFSLFFSFPSTQR